MDRLVKMDVTVLSITVDVMSDTFFLNMLDAAKDHRCAMSILTLHFFIFFTQIIRCSVL